MLKHWNALLNTDCVVVDIGPHTIYPMFCGGSTSITRDCDRKYINEQIQDCTHINVLLRDPAERYVAGVNEYCEQHGKDIKETCRLIEHGELANRHFAPQYVWLLHLSKFYKGDITLRPFDYIKEVTDLHVTGTERRDRVRLNESFIQVDQQLMKYRGQTVALVDIIKRYKNVLS
jgi:hypothetical protein